ncbi:MAG TPA: hypothetical protein VD993_15975 [Chitinophagaceae bacterium]|nr:hypothetical protein [Chitinophagaceae bacterium]
MKKLIPTVASLGMLACIACNKEHSVSNAQLIIKFRFDSTQVRLNNVGQPSVIPSGRAAQHPIFSKMSAHYIELAPTAFTPLGGGKVLYRALETGIGGSTAIDFQKASFARDNEVFFSMPLKDVKPGKYEWLRISLAYQNAHVKFKVDTIINGFPIQGEYTGTLAGFIGFNTYITNFTINRESVTVNANRKQGFWGFETVISGPGFSVPVVSTGQAPPGATTVVNPIFSTSPIPPGSCVVTAAFVPGKLNIIGNETKDIIIEASFSTNKSFEWEEIVHDGKWEPGKGEKVVDMGIRGMVPKIK